jgi:L-ribulose-5-phosphate 3-epimerase
MNNYSLGLYEKSMPNSLPIPEKLAEAKNAGFDFLEISIDETDEKLSRLKWDQLQRGELKESMRANGFEIRSVCLSGHRKYPIGSEDDAFRARGMEIMSDAIQFAADTGIKIIQIAGYDEYYRPSNDNTRRFFLENLRKSADIAAEKGIILAFETMETEFMNTVQKAMNYVDLVQSPYLQIYPDLGNITNAAVLYGHSVSDDLRSATGHIVALHLKETVPGIFREVPYGQGHVDFDSAIRLAWEMGVRMFLAEFWYTGNADWQYQLTIANEFIRSKFNNLK